jgi:eukaryotic-like serine/threonine-protein kinase
VSDVFQPEQVIGGRYRVVRKLGGGGMADVYLCEDLTLGRHVAIKVLLQRYLNDPTFVERFRREAKAAAGLNQQNLVAIYDWGEVDGTYYIVMEYVEGETLKDLIRRRGRLSGNESVAVTLQLLAAVDFAHRSGIVHRDIKPQNIMIDRDGTAKVMDFGIARAGDSGMTEAGSILGTAQYLAPEQAKGYPVDERSDLYSVGVCLYEMLTGTVPFKGDSAVTVALKHVNEVPVEPSELVPGMPYAMNQIVLKAMAKDPGDRYQSAAEFARDLRAAREGGPVQAAAFDAGGERTRVMGAVAAGTTSVLDQPMPPRRKKSKWPLVLIILLLAIIAAVAVALWWTMSGNKVAVPGVVGLSKAAAVKALQKDGFKVGVQQEYSDRVAEGFVSRQSPTADTRMREGGRPARTTRSPRGRCSSRTRPQARNSTVATPSPTM